MPDETPVTVTDLQARIFNRRNANVDSFSGQWMIKLFCRCVFGGVAFVYCLSVCVQHKSKSSERILTNFSEKVSNDKICNCTTMPCSLLIGYHLSNIYTVSQKNVTLFYFCDIFVQFHPILLIFGRNMPQEI